MQNCHSCQHSLPSGTFFYCPNCPQQIRCKGCHEELLPGASRCVMCGTLVGERESSDRNKAEIDRLVPTVSTIKFSETNGASSRELEAQITDTLGTSWSDAAVASFFTGRASGRLNSYSSTRTASENPQQLSLIESDAPDEKSVVDVTADSEVEKHNAANRFEDIFRCRDGQVQLIETRLKAENKLDAARRLTYLFLLYREDEDQDEASRTDLTKVLRQVGLDDSNTSNWIRKSPDLITENSMVGLRISGKEKAERILEEVLDSSVETKWSLDKTSTSRRSKTGNESNDSSGSVKSQNRKASEMSADVEDWVSKWQPISSEISFHDTLKSSSVAQKGCFGIWAIGKATENPDVVSAGKLQKFLHLGFGLKVDKRNLSRRLNEMEGKGELIKVKGGFKLLSTGVDAIEKKLKSKQDSGLEELDLWQDREEA